MNLVGKYPVDGKDVIRGRVTRVSGWIVIVRVVFNRNAKRAPVSVPFNFGPHKEEAEKFAAMVCGAHNTRRVRIKEAKLAWRHVDFTQHPKRKSDR